MPSACLALGANLGDPESQIRAAIGQLRQHAAIEFVKVSTLRTTQPAGGPRYQPDYCNGAVLIETALPPTELLAVCQRLEDQHQRQRDLHWGPRPLDLDILLYDNLVLHGTDLTIPHPRMRWRRFVLEPLAEIAPDYVHPIAGQTIRELADRLQRKPWYVALAGPLGVGKTTLARELARSCRANLLSEEFDQMPALRTFYDNCNQWAAALQNQFLHSRTIQLAADRFTDQEADWVVSDFCFDQTIVFAEINLKDEALRAFRQRFQEQRRRVLEPTLVVWLHDEPEHLLPRIQERGRDFEQALTKHYLADLCQQFERYFAAEHGYPVLQTNEISEVEAAMQAVMP